MGEIQYQEPKQQYQYVEDKELSLKELVLGVVDFAKEVLRNWWIIPIFCILVGCYFVNDYLNHVETYRARLTFMLNDDAQGGGGMGGIGALLGDLGGKKKGSALVKIVQLFKSRTVIDKAVLKQVEIDGKLDFLGNHFIDEYDGRSLVSDFKGSLIQNFKDIDNFRFTHDEIEKFNGEERIMLKVIYYTIVGHQNITEVPVIMGTKLDEDSGIMTLTSVTTKENLTLGLIHAIYENLSAFFINKAIEKQKKVYDIINFKKDSVRTALALAEYKLADFEDSNRKLVTVKGYLEKMKLTRETRILNVMYGEIVKNMEVADFSLRSKTPYVQEIDMPFRPLSPSVASLGLAIFKSIIIGSFLAILFIIFRKLIRDALAT